MGNKHVNGKSPSDWAIVGALLTLVVATILAYIYLLPLFIDFFAKRVPQKYEVEIGKSLYKSILESEKIDTLKTENINKFFAQIDIETDYPIEISVVKSNIPNAFALPGGGIVVYTKILENMKTPEELAALLSHEFSHVQLKHATRNIFRSLAGSLFISVILGDVSGLTAVIIQNAEQLRGLHYTRSLEQEADNNGLQILKQNKLDAAGMKALFEHLQKASSIDIPELVSTHPDLENRILNVEQFIEDNKYETATNDNLEYYFNQITK